MKQTWRWFGPHDLVSIDDIRQAGASGIVSALHHIPTGQVWPPHEIALRQQQIAALGDGTASTLTWDVVESLPVSEAIKKQTGDWRRHIEAYRDSLRHLAAAGIKIICYNFMPVLDWTRTDLTHRLPTGATCMRFDLVDFVVFEGHLLQRPGARADYGEALWEAAARRRAELSDGACGQLVANVVSGLPGAADHYTLDDVRQHLGEYAQIDAARLQAHLTDFLAEVVPLAEALGVCLCCHPDDPPFPLLGLPRIMSTEAHYVRVMEAVDSPANGITLCSGSLGARPDNDLPGMMTRLGDRVHFLHLRNVKRESQGIVGSFYEAEHLQGDTDMVALIRAVLAEEARRRAVGRKDRSIPFRPDHGHDILDDQRRKTQPGYPAIGRLRGLAELRGVIAALSHPAVEG
ncbi:MAG: mannonate dehydratase [Candidatus Competibacterales bacterium]